MTPEQLDEARVKEADRQTSHWRAGRSPEKAFDVYRRLVVTNWTPPETVDPDLLAAREWASVEWKSNQINRMTGDRDYAAEALAGAFDSHPTIRAYLAGCTRGREGAKGLVEALEDMCALVKQNTYPQPDKPDTPWGRLQRALAALAAAKGERV